jgi:hypothetical protein
MASTGIAAPSPITTTPSPPTPRTARHRLAWTCLALLGLSLAIRLPLVAWTDRHGVGLVFDESGYLAQAGGFRDLFAARWSGEPKPGAANRAYRGGVWPPLHPALLGLGLWWSGDGMAAARAVVALLGAAATPLVFLVGERLFRRRAALVAAVGHAIYPGFVGFSHYLWSESTYIAILLLAVYCALVAADAEARRPALWAAAACGVALGLGALTRAAALPYLLVVPAWLAVARRRRPGALLCPLLALACCAATAVPWQLTLARREGRPILLSTAAGLNLLKGNRPTTAASRGDLRRTIAQRAQRDGVHPDAAARALALEEIARNPLAAVGRATTRLRTLFQPDNFVLHHLFNAVYPPLPAVVAGSIVLWVLVSFVLLITLAAWGWWAAPALPREMALFGLLLVAGALPPMATVSSTRIGLPLMALLLPFAGRGAVQLREIARQPRRAALAGFCAVVVLVSAARLAAHGSLSVESSSYYRDLTAPLDRALGVRPTSSDCLQLQATESTAAELLTLETAPGYRFRRPAVTTLTWRPAQIRQLNLELEAEAPREPLLVRIAAGAGEAGAVTIAPVAREAWQAWRESGVAGVSYRWCGGGRWPVASSSPSDDDDGD